MTWMRMDLGHEGRVAHDRRAGQAKPAAAARALSISAAKSCSSGAVALLELLAAAAWARIVAADLWGLAPDGLDLVAELAGEVVEGGDDRDHVGDGFVPAFQRMLAVEGLYQL